MRLTHLAYAISLLGLAAATTAHAADNDSAAVSLDKVEITGSSIKRIAQEGSLPVTVMSREDIARTGATTAQDLVNSIPSNFGGSVTSANIGGNLGTASTAGMRGLPAYYTLVLINGHRVASYLSGNIMEPVTDLNSIPMSMVERVEVLRDGASSLYGADAIAGVINFILKKDFKGVEASYTDTASQHGGAANHILSVTGGWGDLDTDRFNVFLGFTQENDKALNAAQRPALASGVRPDLGLFSTKPYTGVINANFTDAQGNTYSGVNPTYVTGCNVPGFHMVPDPANIGTCRTDAIATADLIPEAMHRNLAGRAEFRLSENHQLSIEASRTTTDISPVRYPAADSNGGAVSVLPGQPFYPSSITVPAGYVMSNGQVLTQATPVTPVGPVSGQWDVAQGGMRRDFDNSIADRLAIELAGTFGAWDYDTTVLMTRERLTVGSSSGGYDWGTLQGLIDNGKINLLGPQTPASLAALQTAQFKGPYQTIVESDRSWDAHFSRELFKLPAGAVQLGTGFEYRRESLDQQPSAEMLIPQPGGVVDQGTWTPISGARSVYGAFVELNAPLSKTLDMTVAARDDEYKNDFGTSFGAVSPKVSMRFRPSADWVFRGSAGRGFRAPSLADNLMPFSSNGTAAAYSDLLRCTASGQALNLPGVPAIDQPNAVMQECNINQVTYTAGNTALKAERSNQWSLGMAFQPTKSLSGSVDYWNIKINNAITLLPGSALFGGSTGAQQNQALLYRYDPGYNAPAGNPAGGPCGAGYVLGACPVSNSGNPQYPIAYGLQPLKNLARFFASGIDLNLHYKTNIAALGTFTANLDGTYTINNGQVDADGNVNSAAGVFNTNTAYAMPRWRHVATFVLARQTWDVSATNNFTLGYLDYDSGNYCGTSPSDVCPYGKYLPGARVASFSDWDLQADYKGIKSVRLTFGVKNVFDRPPSVSRQESYTYQRGYDAQYGNPIGRAYYLTANYKWQ